MPPERPDPVASRARRRGILTEYVDASGREQRASRSTIEAIERALGPFQGAAARDVPVLLATPGSPRPLLQGRRRGGSAVPRARLGFARGRRGRARPRGSRSGAPVGASIPLGVHNIRVSSGRRVREGFLIVAPRRLPARRGRRWGLFAPVYALRDARTWGCGDLRALEELGRWAADRGASALATLPLLPAFLERPFDPSPYRPVSRRFWNEVYLDVPSTSEFRRSASLRSWCASAPFRARVAALERRPVVDFRAVYRLKRHALEQMLREFSRAPAARRRAFARFIARTPGLDEYARFRARHARDRRREAAYHRFVQWLTDEQLRAVARRLRRRGVELVLDRPLGTHPDGFDARADADLYVHGVSLGSPPDPGVPDGQDWGFAPFHPERLRASGFRPLVEDLRHEFSVAGMLRIDHVLGWHRQYWIPHGRRPSEGAYVRQRARELYAIVRAEAARASAQVIGEDLGTVPPELRPALRRQGLLALYVAQLEWDGAGTARPIPRACVASLNTHDQLPFAGYWAERRHRGATGTTEAGFPSGDTPTHLALRDALVRLARSPAQLLLVNLEDLWGESRPQNVPGAIGPYFARRCARTLEELRADVAGAQLLSIIDASRRRRYVRCLRPSEREAPAGAR